MDVIGQRLRIKYDAARLSTGSIAEAVAQTGMRAWLEHEEPVPVAATAETRFRLLAVSGVAFASGLAATFAGAPAPVLWVAFGLAIGFGGIFTAKRAAVSIASRTLDINVLMVIAVAGALALGQSSEAASVVF